MRKIILLALITLSLFGCKKTESPDEGFNNNPAEQTITTTVAGRVINQMNEPVSGAIVKAGSASATTDINGEFTLTNARLKEDAAYVTVEKQGYFTGSRTFIAKSNDKHLIDVMLLYKSLSGSVNNNNGGTVMLPSGAAVTLPANSVVMASTGAAYTGIVNVAMTWIDPTSSGLHLQMPGDLRGINEAGEENVLHSLGMVGVELTGSGGEKLQIAPGKKAGLRLPIPNSVLATAPATIAFWSLNDSTGIWKQEGVAPKSGNYYLGEASHFSWWNCDIGVPLARVKALITDLSGNIQKGKLVKVKALKPELLGNTRYGYTDNSGYIDALVPANTAIQIEMTNGFYPTYCTGASVTIGPFTANSIHTIEPLKIANSLPYIIQITGSVKDCNNQPLTNGYVKLKFNNGQYLTAVTNGSFAFSSSVCSNAPISAEGTAVNSSNLNAGVPQTLTLTTGNNIIDLVACGSPTANSQFLQYTLGNDTYYFNETDSLVLRYRPPTSANEFPSFDVFVSPPQLSPNYPFLMFGFSEPALSTSTLKHMTLVPPSFQYYNVIGTSAILINLTEFGTTPGAYIAGSFTATARTSIGQGQTGQTIDAPFTCSFRIKRRN